MLDCLKVKNGIIVPRNYITEEQIRRFVKGTSLENYQIIDDDLPLNRQLLQQKADKVPVRTSAEFGSVIVDHSFNVKGIGAVALGVVREGQIHKHDKLESMPTNKITQVRSIQKHDDDFNAELGDRVGLALKGVEADELYRGLVLTNNPNIKSCSKLICELKPVKYWINPIKVGMAVHVGNGMQFIAGTLENISDKIVEISMNKPMAYVPGDKITLMYLNGGNLRVIGTITPNIS